MGPPSSVDSASAAVNAGVASRVARAQHFQVAPFRTTSSPWPCGWYVRYRLSYTEVSEWLAERGVLVDQSTIYRWGQRFVPLFGEAARTHRDPIGPDWRWTRRTPASADAGTTSIAPSTETARSWTPMCRRRATWLPRAGSSSGRSRPPARRRVITDKAATYPPALAAAVPGALHRTGRYRTNGVERDHGFLKERLRPMRGLKSVASAAIFVRGHALMRNIRHGFYRLVESVPQRLVIAWTWTQLAEAV